MKEQASPGTLAIVVGSILLTGGLLGGAGLILAMLISAFGDVAFVEASQRSRVLSEGIQDAVGYGGCFGGGVGGFGAVLIALGVRRRRAARR
ncbi:MAG: hypothetical protein H6719_13515 [Sandaracinaceae bacterium]|nr:hypothetical protein [Sandaracinaceae bacterium]